MNLLGSCEVQYANNLLSQKKAVLRVDRERGDNPLAKFYDLSSEQKLLIKITGDVKTENMTSSPSAGAKDRTDIYFFDYQLNNIINILQPFVESLLIEFDETPRSVADPTGMEHPDGLQLGQIYTITSLTAKCVANYADKSFSVTTKSKVYIDAERKRGNKFHLGTTMNNVVSIKSCDINCFEIYIDYLDTKRLLHSVKVAKKLLT